MSGPDGSFTATLFLPLQGDHRMAWGFRELDSWTRQSAFMDANFPDVTPAMPDLRDEFEQNKIGLMGTVHCQAWHAGGTALLIGDAAHCIVPFHGQGVNAALEDCTTLDEILDGDPADWETAFRALEERRRPNTEAIAQMALDAYHTMRESVRHRDFLLRKALERELEIRHPDRFVARYSLVMFHRIPYTEAWERGRAQGAILDELLRDKSELAEVDLAEAARLVALGGLRSGLWAAQRDDYPVTVKSGHSGTELWLATDEMPLTTVVSPDVFAVISADGFAKAGPYLSAMRSDGLVLTIPDYADVVTDAQVVVIDPKAAPQRIPKTSLGLVFLSAALALTSPYPMDALLEAAGAGSFAEVNLEAVETGIGLASG